jgi:hypothetical protein
MVQPKNLAFKCFLLFFIFFQNENIFAQKDSLAGYWEGILTVEREGDVLAEYNFALRFSEENKKIVGISYVWYQNMGANMEFEIQLLDENTIQIKETAIRKSDPLPSGEWCMKEMILHKKTDKESTYWQGEWTGKTTFSNCTPGKITVKRSVERA